MMKNEKEESNMKCNVTFVDSTQGSELSKLHKKSL